MNKAKAVTSPLHSPIPRFVIGVLLIMPFAIGLWWFWLREFIVAILQLVVNPICQWLWSDYFISIASQIDKETGVSVWNVRTTLSPITDPRQLLAIPVTTQRFSISFPLLWGLILATPDNNKGWQLPLGTLLIVPFCALIAVLLIQFRIAIHINYQPILAEFPNGPYVLALPFSDTVYYLMAVGRQLAVLVLPTLGPLLVWGVFNRHYVRSTLYGGLMNRGRPPTARPASDAGSSP